MIITGQILLLLCIVFKYNKATELLKMFVKLNKSNYSIRNKFECIKFKTNLKKFSFISISTKLLNAYIFTKIFMENYKTKYLIEHLSTLFDKYCYYFYDRDPYV